MAKKAPEEKSPLPDSPPASKVEVAIAHVNNHRPMYLWLPLGSLACFGALHLYYFITGRAAMDEVPVGAIWNVLIANIVVIMVNCTKPLLFDDISTLEPNKYPLWQVALDYISTFFLLVFFWYVVAH